MSNPGWADWAAVEKIDPELPKRSWHEVHRENTKIELIASENFSSPGGAGCSGTPLTNKYAEGYPGKPLLRRVRVRRRRREPRHRPGESALRRRARERAASCRSPGERRRVLRLPPTGRQVHGHGVGARRPPHSRLTRQFLGKVVRRRLLRRERGRRDDRLRPGARRRSPRAPEDVRGRMLRVLPDLGFRSVPGHRGRGRCDLPRGCRALHRSRGGRRAPQSRGVSPTLSLARHTKPCAGRGEP